MSCEQHVVEKDELMVSVPSQIVLLLAKRYFFFSYLCHIASVHGGIGHPEIPQMGKENLSPDLTI
jgi:hypothetical protein